MKECKLRMEDALNATRAAVEEGIVAGGGTAYIEASKKVAELVASLEGDEKTGAKIIMKPSGWKMGRNKKGERNAGITDIIATGI